MKKLTIDRSKVRTRRDIAAVAAEARIVDAARRFIDANAFLEMELGDKTPKDVARMLEKARACVAKAGGG